MNIFLSLGQIFRDSLYIYIVVLVIIQYFIMLTAQNASSMQCGFTPATYSSLQIKSPFLPFFGLFQGTLSPEKYPKSYATPLDFWHQTSTQCCIYKVGIRGTRVSILRSAIFHVELG